MAKAIYAQVDLVNYKNTVNGECVRGVHECFYDSYDTRVYIYFFIHLNINCNKNFIEEECKY